MKKNISMSIRVSEEELEKIKIAAMLQEYSSYSEFVRRTALIEAARIIKKMRNLTMITGGMKYEGSFLL